MTRLPARYIRHDNDMAFYLAPGEPAGMLDSVASAVNTAANFIYQQRKSNAR